MRLGDRLAKQQQNNKKKPVQETEEETLTYLSRKREHALNEGRGVFQGKTFEGINTEKNVFDRTAVFHVREEQ